MSRNGAGEYAVLNANEGDEEREEKGMRPIRMSSVDYYSPLIILFKLRLGSILINLSAMFRVPKYVQKL